MADITFTAGAVERVAYVSQPAGPGPWPGVVLIHEIFGLTDDMRVLSDRVAAMGYLAMAPDFYNGGRWSKCMRVAFRELAAGSGEFFDAIEATRGRLSGDERCTGTVGVIGFCLGGGFALLAAARYPFSAASVNYAEVPEDAERVLAGACPIIASYGGRDRTMRGQPERLRRALSAAGVQHDVKTYPPAGHSFLSLKPYPPAIAVMSTLKGMHGGPHPASADDAWRRIDRFFSTHLRSEP